MSSVDEQAKIIWDYMLVHDKLETADIIICLGSHDLGVARRAAELYNQKLAPKILITGGRGKLTTDNLQTEADAYSAIMLTTGVAKTDILIEDRASNTGENVEFSHELLNDINLDIISAIIVTKPYMERRAKATFAQLWPELRTMVASQQISYDEYMSQDSLDKKDSINVMVGDLQRIMTYPSKGWMARQDVPDPVESAFKYLVEIGYDKYLT